MNARQCCQQLIQTWNTVFKDCAHPHSDECGVFVLKCMEMIARGFSAIEPHMTSAAAAMCRMDILRALIYNSDS